MKVIVLTGGGTSGHVTPNIALIPKLKAKGFTIHYIGSKNGIERRLIEREGIPYYPVNAGKLRRYLDFQNITDIFRIADGFRQALSILRKIKPDVVFSKGGFVSCPVVWAAWVRRIPVVIHESDITPGLTNKLSMPFAGKVCYTFPESEKYLDKKKSCHTGLPIREEIDSGNRLRGLKLCGFSSIKPTLLVIGGSQGSENINRAVRSVLDQLLDTFQICHICGKGKFRQELEGVKGYKQFEYIHEELPDVFACADVFISRAGATVLYEILSVKKPSLLIPLSHHASRGDQILNAQSFQRHGYSEVLYEEDITDETLIKQIKELYHNREQYMKVIAENSSQNALTKITDIIQQVSG